MHAQFRFACLVRGLQLLHDDPGLSLRLTGTDYRVQLDEPAAQLAAVQSVRTELDTLMRRMAP